MSIMVRAEITEAEWKAFRKLCIDLGVPIQQLVGRAITQKLDEYDATPKEAGR